jgi:hypothetical protein
MRSMALRLGVAAAVAGAMVIPAPTHAEPKKVEAKAAIERKMPEARVKKDVFSGSEFRVAAMNYVNADCSSGPIPDVRIVAQPGNGELRTEQIRYIVDRGKDDSRNHCNGKEVDALGLFYKSRDGFTGQDQIAVDVDYRNGRVQRFLYVIAVR